MLGILYKPCVLRQKLTKVTADGHKEQLQQCKCQKAVFFGLAVFPADCETCPHRKESTEKENRRKVYDAENPPPVPPRPMPEGTVKAIPDEPLEGSAWPPCMDRLRLTIVKACGRTRFARWCESEKSPEVRTEVTTSICKLCPHRRAYPETERKDDGSLHNATE